MLLVWNSDKCLSLPQRCVMMRMIAVCVSPTFSTSLCLNRMPPLDPLNLLSRHTCDSAHDPVRPHRPGGRWQPTHRSDLWLCRRSDSVTSPVLSHAVVAATETNRWLQSCCFQRQKSAWFDQSRQYLLPSSSCHYCTWKARVIVVWCVSVCQEYFSLFRG